MASRPICPGCDSDDADFRRAMRAKRACPHCRLPAAAITAVWYVRAHNVRPRRRTKDQLDNLLDHVTQLEHENSRLAQELKARDAPPPPPAAADPEIVARLEADLSSARTQLAQRRTDIEDLQEQNRRLVDQLQSPPIVARLERLHADLVPLRDTIEQLEAENARLHHKLATQPVEPTVIEVPTPDPALVEQLRTLRRDMTGETDAVMATAQKLRDLLVQPGLDAPAAAARGSSRTDDRTDRVFTPGDPVRIGVTDAPWFVTRTWQAHDPWVKIRHSVRTHEHREIRVRILVKHQLAIASAPSSRRLQDVFAARLRSLRVEHSLTQGELATLGGLPPRALRTLEHGQRRYIEFDALHDLATALDVHPADLFHPPATGDPAQ